MELSKKEVIDKILSFNYSELADWINTRLHGEDKYFPVYLRHEPNITEFLIDVFHHIKNEQFRDNFIEILGDLTKQLRGFTRSQIEESKKYISELLILCGNIKQFENKDTLMEIAVSGKFKGVALDEETDLHADLLTTLASYRIAGNFDFWIEQLYDASNKYYANPAFYVLSDNPDKLFEHIHIFIDKFKGEIELVLGIESLIDKYGPVEIIRRFKGIEGTLSREQREAVNQAFKDADYNDIYILDAAASDELQYPFQTSSMQKVSQPTPGYGISAALKENTGEIFKLMGFDVEFNREIGGHEIDIFIKKKKTIGNKYECSICDCKPGNRKKGKKIVTHFYSVREAVRNQLKKQPDSCDECEAIIISEKGFTKGAVDSANEYGIELMSYEKLLYELVKFHSNQKKLTRDFESLKRSGRLKI
jgi:hypothetical protein